jgi:aspartyl-tRNA(Asn)/glutamyl-tRNA(Gln) amidotransferase subunit C
VAAGADTGPASTRKPTLDERHPWRELGRIDRLRRQSMAITRETVLHVAKLARLELGESEVERMQRDLGGILDYIALLSELDTEGVPETAHVAVAGMPFRDDRPVPGLPNEIALLEAPRKVDGSFAVPGFVDES